MKPDPIDQLGARLFEAARREPLPEGALERALAAARREPVSSDSGSRLSRRTTATLWLAAAALAAGAVLFVRNGEPTSGISAEPSSSMQHNRAPQPPSHPAPVADAAPSATTVERSIPSAAPAPSTPPPVHSAPATLTDELSSLKLASSALSAGDARAALAALDQYDRMKGQKMRAEATLLRIEALARAGQPDAASTLAKRFVEQNPESPLVDRARSFVQQ
jgi:hypothetical protein